MHAVPGTQATSENPLVAAICSFSHKTVPAFEVWDAEAAMTGS